VPLYPFITDYYIIYSYNVRGYVLTSITSFAESNSSSWVDSWENNSSNEKCFLSKFFLTIYLYLYTFSYIVE
jgi:hypothetical protein